MTIKEFMKEQAAKEKAAERIIKRMEIREEKENLTFLCGNIVAYHNYWKDYYIKFAEIKYNKEYYFLSMEEKFPYDREQLKRFVIYCLGEHKEEEIKLILYKQKEM